MATTMIKFSSGVNGEILLTQKDGHTRITVDGFVESGIEVENIWNPAFDKLIPSNEKLNQILILGFAGGSVVPLIKSRWPNAKITGIEIDPVMVGIVKKYLPQNIIGVDLVVSDAVIFVNSLASHVKFDLVLVDCYLHGITQLNDSQNISFLLQLKKIGSHILMNQLLYPAGDYPLKKTEYLRKLDGYCSVKVLRLPHNVMISY